MISEDLLGHFIDLLLSEGYSFSSIDYERYSINISLEPNLSLRLSFPSKNSNSLLLNDYFYFIITKYNDSIKEMFGEDKIKAFVDAYQKELFFSSLSREDLLDILKDLDDEVLCYIMSFVSDEQYEQIMHANNAKNGEMVVAMNDNNEVTLKTFYKEDGHFRLQPENDYMEPIILDNVTVLGKAIGLYRKF